MRKLLKLLEFEAKQIISNYGIPTPAGGLAKSVQQANSIASNLNPPFVIKAQIPVAGRGKAGGILFANSTSQTEEVAEKLLKAKIKGIPVRSLWIEEKIQTKNELYFGFTVDRFNQKYVAMATTVGGMDIEEVTNNDPDKIIKFPINPRLGFHSFRAREIVRKMGYSGSQLLTLADVFERLYRVLIDYDAVLIETNPLVETLKGKFVAVDARIIIDDNALFRHQEYKERLLAEESEFTSQEQEALRKGLGYVELDGEVGVIGNGAGLVMATLDIVKHYGGKPANFLDIGGGATSEQMFSALHIVLSDPKVKVVLINIMGGITRCDEVAKGIVEARRKIGISKPMIIRLVGTNEEKGKEILTEEGISVLQSMEKAAQTAVKKIYK